MRCIFLSGGGGDDISHAVLARQRCPSFFLLIHPLLSLYLLFLFFYSFLQNPSKHTFSMRPATPGFLVTLIATILLAVVSFSVPWFKSIFFLKASLAVEGVSGSITFGVLGYCLELNNGTTCSKPSIGYELGKTLLQSLSHIILTTSP